MWGAAVIDGRIEMRRGETPEVLAALQAGAANGDIESMLAWAKIMARSPETVATAEALWRSAAERGSVEAWFRLGLLLVRRGDIDEGEMWLRKGAEQGDMEAIAALASLLESRGDDAEARHWFSFIVDR